MLMPTLFLKFITQLSRLISILSLVITMSVVHSITDIVTFTHDSVTTEIRKYVNKKMLNLL